MTCRGWRQGGACGGRHRLGLAAAGGGDNEGVAEFGSVRRGYGGERLRGDAAQQVAAAAVDGAQREEGDAAGDVAAPGTSALRAGTRG